MEDLTAPNGMCRLILLADPLPHLILQEQAVRLHHDLCAAGQDMSQIPRVGSTLAASAIFQLSAAVAIDFLALVDEGELNNVRIPDALLGSIPDGMSPLMPV